MQCSTEIVRDKNQMLRGFDLIKELTPSLTLEQYQTYLDDMIRAGYFQLHAYIDQNLVGLSGIWIGTKIYSGKYLEMDNVVVNENYRSAGIGQTLYVEVEKIAKENNCAMIMLDAYRENTRAHGFYERKGFIKRGYHFIKKLA